MTTRLKVLPSLEVNLAEKVADRAFELATRFIERETQQIVTLSGGDHKALREAARIVRDRGGQHAGTRSAEHLAFGLIVSAHELVMGATRGPHNGVRNR